MAVTVAAATTAARIIGAAGARREVVVDTAILMAALAAHPHHPQVVALPQAEAVTAAALVVAVAVVAVVGVRIKPAGHVAHALAPAPVHCVYQTLFRWNHWISWMSCICMLSRRKLLVVAVAVSAVQVAVVKALMAHVLQAATPHLQHRAV